MKRFLVGSIVFLAAAVMVSSALKIRQGGTVNTAGYNRSTARGAFMAIFGKELAAQTATAATAYPSTQELSGTVVSVTPIGSTPNAAYVYYVSALQINGRGTSAAARITVVDSQYGIFTINQAGRGAAMFRTSFRLLV